MGIGIQSSCKVGEMRMEVEGVVPVLGDSG